MENTSGMINSLAFKNNPNKERLGQCEIIPKLVKQHRVYSKLNNFPALLKNNLKALGNLTAIPDNCKKISDNGMVPQINDYI